MTNAASNDNEMAILRRIPSNPVTLPARQWLVGDRDDDEITAADIREMMLWSDHAVAIKTSLEMTMVEHPGYYITVDRAGDLEVIDVETGTVVDVADPAAELERHLDDDAVDVVACLTEGKPERLRSVGKEIVTDGGITDPGAQRYCQYCHCWRSVDDGDCHVCGRSIDGKRDVITDGGRDTSTFSVTEGMECAAVHVDTAQTDIEIGATDVALRGLLDELLEYFEGEELVTDIEPDDNGGGRT